MNKNKPRCEECVNASIYDRDLDYTPNLHCKLDHETIEVDIMEFHPKEETCEDYKEGDPEWI
jgi:hypothetical protein